MKLNYKRTILVGFAFFLISAFWQAYDATIPVILTNKFGLKTGPATVIGIIGIIAALVIGILLAWFGGSLFQVAVSICVVVFVAELFLI